MGWSWSQIDWGATLWLALVPPLLVAAMTLDVLDRWRRAGWTAHLLIAACVIASAALLVTIGEHAGDGPFGQTTAAWVQGVGSVLAIIGAVWIDQGSARRQAAAFAAERERNEDELQAALTARHQALLECQAALSILAKEVSATGPDGAPRDFPVRFSKFALRRLKSAQISVSYYLITPGAIPHNMLSALAGASQLVDEFQVSEETTFGNEIKLSYFREKISSAQEQIQYIFDVMDFDFLPEISEQSQ